MKFFTTSRDKASWLKVLSGICGNLSAGWFGHILISPGFELFADPIHFLTLTRSLFMGILFMWLAFLFDRSSK